MTINELISKLKEHDGELTVKVFSNGADKAYPISHVGQGHTDGVLDTYVSIVVDDDRNLVDLSKVWHDASEKPILHKPILIQCGYPLHTYEATALSEDVIWGDFVVLNAIFRWAYIKDLLPKGGEK